MQLVFFFYSFKCIQFWLSWLIACAILSFFIGLTHIIITESKVFNHTLLGTLKLFLLFYSFTPFVMLYILTLAVPYIVSLFPTIYIYPLFKPFFLLQSPLKYFFLLRSLVWPLFPGSTLAVLYIMSIFIIALIGSLFSFFSFIKVYQFGSTILSWRPL